MQPKNQFKSCQIWIIIYLKEVNTGHCISTIVIRNKEVPGLPCKGEHEQLHTINTTQSQYCPGVLHYDCEFQFASWPSSYQPVLSGWARAGVHYVAKFRPDCSAPWVHLQTSEYFSQIWWAIFTSTKGGSRVHRKVGLIEWPRIFISVVVGIFPSCNSLMNRLISPSSGRPEPASGHM